MATETQTEQAERVEQKPKPVVKALKVEFDLTKLWMADIPLAHNISTSKPYSIIDAMSMLDRLIVGGLAERELTQYQPILTKLVDAIVSMINPKSEG